ncbi:PAS domain S-box protein [Methanocalculus chunghsingensis]|uniref:PAS domain S-box protein n=1 Tax=Methanocalculus chunghsingensis TaxID=156457 RepID=UPI001B8AB423|nr:PAS domain S-box protein [Methanocalculus chunghsingensis]
MPSYPAEVTRITELLRGNPRGMSVGEIADAISINRNTAARYLDMLLIGGQVEMRTFGKAKVFFLSQRVPIGAMLNIASDLVMVLDQHASLILANDQILAFCGAIREEVIGKSLDETPLIIFSHPALKNYIRESNGRSGSDEVIRLMKGGNEHLFRQKVFPTVFDDGTPGITVILEDITEQKKAEEALRQSEELFRTLVSDISDVIWSTDETGTITYISPRSEAVCGIVPEEMNGRKFTDFMDPLEAREFRRRLQPSISAGQPWPLIECSFRRPDGAAIIIELSGAPITLSDAEGNPVFLGYRGAFRNVTERNRALKHVKQWKTFLNSIVENIPDIVTVEELENHTLVFFNRAAEEFIGVPREFLTGQKAEKIFPDLLAGSWQETTATVMASGETLELVVEIRDDGNGSRTLSTKKIPIFSSCGDMRYILSISRDITEERQEAERILIERDLALRFEGAASFREAAVPCLDAFLAVSGMKAGRVFRRNGSDEIRSLGCAGEDLLPETLPPDADEYLYGEIRHLERPSPEIFGSGIESLLIIPIVREEAISLSVILGSDHERVMRPEINSRILSLQALTKTGFSRLIAEERLKEERDCANSYLQLAGVLIAVISRDGTVRMINKKGSAILGYTEDELIGADWFETVVPENIRDQLRERFNHLVESGVEPRSRERNPIIDRKGEIREIWWHNTVIRDESGTITAVVSAGEEERSEPFSLNRG